MVTKTLKIINPEHFNEALVFSDANLEADKGLRNIISLLPHAKTAASPTVKIYPSEEYLCDKCEASLYTDEGLADNDKAAIIDDVKKWSGGSTPDDMNASQIDAYLDSSLSSNYGKKTVSEFFAAGPLWHIDTLTGCIAAGYFWSKAEAEAYLPEIIKTLKDEGVIVSLDDYIIQK